MDYTKLQNGSDIRGIALEGIEGQHVNLTEQAAADIAGAFCEWLSERKKKPAAELCIGIGRDPRISGEALLNAAAGQLSDMGVTVHVCGLASTPAMFMTTVMTGYRYDGAIMITASHLPFNRNGMKFFTDKGGTEKSEIAEILALAGKGGFKSATRRGEILPTEFMSLYCGHLVEKVRAATGSQRPLEGLRVVVDAGNGSGGFYVTGVLEPLGADTAGSQFLQPDGTFPNHMPNPENEQAMQALVECVQRNNADLGIIFDTDVDRAGAVDKEGREINRNRLIAMMASIVLEEDPGSTIVTDSITSSGLKQFIEGKGGVHHRFKRGYKNVINEAIRLNNEGRSSALAMETSGHGALRENYFLDDGAYLMTKLIIQLAKLGDVSPLIEGLKEPAESCEIRMTLTGDGFAEYGKKIIEALFKYSAEHGWAIAPDNHEGIRVAFDKDAGDGWFLLRMSLHDPLMPLNIESDTQGGTHKIAAQLYGFLKAYPLLDTSKLAEYAG